MKITIVRDILVIATSIISFLVVYIKIIHSLFMEVIKMKYKDGPGKQSLFGIIVRGTTYVFIFLYIMLLIYTFASMGDSIKSSMNWNEIYHSMPILICALLIMIAIATTFSNFFHIAVRFQYKIQKPNDNNLKNKYEIRNLFNTIFTGLIATGLAYWIYLKFRYEIFLELIEQQVEGANNLSDNMNSFLTNCAFELLLLGIFVTCIKLQEIIKDIRSDITYILFYENEEIKCKCYLEYKEYYLIVEENSIERYINKSKVKEIRKIYIKYHVSVLITGLISAISFCINKIKVGMDKIGCNIK